MSPLEWGDRKGNFPGSERTRSQAMDRVIEFVRVPRSSEVELCFDPPWELEPLRFRERNLAHSAPTDLKGD